MQAIQATQRSAFGAVFFFGLVVLAVVARCGATPRDAADLLACVAVRRGDSASVTRAGFTFLLAAEDEVAASVDALGSFTSGSACRGTTPAVGTAGDMAAGWAGRATSAGTGVRAVSVVSLEGSSFDNKTAATVAKRSPLITDAMVQLRTSRRLRGLCSGGRPAAR